MRLPFRRRRAARGEPISLIPLAISLSSLAASPAGALSFTPAPAANLDLSQLGRVALAGDFSGISLYQFEGQNERPFRTNGSEELLARMPNGVFASIVKTDATIRTMCAFDTGNGTVVVMGGNFTSIRGSDSGAAAMQSAAIALFDPATAAITPVDGLSGQVNALFCDQDRDAVYVGGSFVGANSTNALAWEGEERGWVNLPFAGFNGPVTSIAKASNGNIIFGGSFTGLGNASTPSTPDGQIINLETARIAAGFSSTAQGFSDPKNVICSTSGKDGAGNTWLLADNTPGFWQAKFKYGFRPTKLRLYNTHQDGRGTKTWRFTALPINGIMNLTYVDPESGRNATCTSECPLSNDKSVEFQDFRFVNDVGMNEFRIDISAFYGSGGGLNGVEIFMDDIFSYAVNDFNEPSCAGLEYPSTATATGPWTETPSFSSTADYLTAQLQAPITNSSNSIVFTPDIRESGRYSVNLYTPGCLQDNTCTTRGQVRLTGQMTADPTKSAPIDVDLFQTNNFDKYDQIYFGAIDASSGTFRPKVTMTPVAGQSLTTMTFVAQRIGFTMINSTGGLNGLYEYAPGSAVNTSEFMKSAFNSLGARFTTGSVVNALATTGDATYIAGNFTSDTMGGIVALKGKDATFEALDGGLDGEVASMFPNGTNLFVGGKFTSTSDNSTKGLNNVALYDTSKKTWSPLGAGVSGKVLRVVGMTMNVTGSTPEVVVSVNGNFDQLLAFGDNAAAKVGGFGIWVPSQGNWLQNVKLPVESVEGVLSASILDLAGNTSFYAGSLASSSLGANGAAILGETLGQLPVDIQPSTGSSASNSLRRRDGAVSDGDVNGVVAGVFDTKNGRNLTILGGHFTATASDGSKIHNLLILDGSNKDQVTGFGDQISQDSTVAALAVHGDVLFAGGKVAGTVNNVKVNGLVTYNLASKSFNTQPPALSGDDGTVSAIAVRSTTGDVYVGGSFTSAGSLGCPGVCFFSTSASQWNQAGRNLRGNVSSLMWATDNILLAGGNLTINNTASTFLAKYDTSSQTWDAYPGGQLPGPVTALTAGTSDGGQIWAAGTSSGSSAVYLEKTDGSTWQTAGESALQPGSAIRGLQVFSLSASHNDSALLKPDEALLLTGHMVLPDFGSASAVLFNGATFTPFALTTAPGNAAGSIARVFSERGDYFAKKRGGKLPLVFVVLIGLAVSLGLMLLIVVAGLVLDRLRKKREGYVPAPTSMYDRGSGIQRIPPGALLEALGRGPGAPPRV
ncbi:hypothetical protein BT67DRAFT_387393 [Trichocladium antarcticum]|uniref:Cellular morphogenesis protein n=1 Tax=Trichocladium antarcticum TaxID=1450529 RepID=A0AAN6UEU2_9PEZI|nr:hypothetical protein BT67DRAFT_387393 [Trichocladium antarcticum]